jgi:hypothetical protein
VKGNQPHCSLRSEGIRGALRHAAPGTEQTSPKITARITSCAAESAPRQPFALISPGAAQDFRIRRDNFDLPAKQNGLDRKFDEQDNVAGN